MLDVPAGQKIGLVGRSGAGKSTIIALLQRLYDPLAGHVLIDGQNIAEVTQESLRSSIAVVQQDISLFHRSLLENLRYGRPEATDEEVYRAVEAAKCTEFINRLPEGFDTLVGERGMKLSGGQRQRLAIARAFLMNAPIVLLDEATSSLDTESEQSIQEALSRLFKGRTVIAIAHRLSTLDAFDRIVVLDRGRIVEDGAPRRLLQTEGGLQPNVWTPSQGGCGANAMKQMRRGACVGALRHVGGGTLRMQQHAARGTSCRAAEPPGRYPGQSADAAECRVHRAPRDRQRAAAAQQLRHRYRAVCAAGNET